jgi:putative ABC transport system substrate-binding protein
MKLSLIRHLPSAFFNRQRDQLVALAARYAVPAIYDRREFVAAGGLIRI